MDTSTGQIFFQRVGYRRTTTRTLPAPMTSLILTIEVICDLIPNSAQRKSTGAQQPRLSELSGIQIFF